VFLVFSIVDVDIVGSLSYLYLYLYPFLLTAGLAPPNCLHFCGIFINDWECSGANMLALLGSTSMSIPRQLSNDNGTPKNIGNARV